MNSQRHYYGVLRTLCVWEIKLGILHRSSPPKTVTVRLSDVAWLVIKCSKAEVQVNINEYRNAYSRLASKANS